ncbi:hypothetical protein CPC08DRAFT_411976 [Agrocybe pediades]|nr:hypothetical protein CPC08DRAFT_411976 [Agrocybe pediades]
MSTSMFSVSKLLGKGRKGSKRGPPSISSVSTEKEKGKKSSLLARATSGDDEQFPGVTTSTFVAEPFDMGTASEKEKVAATSTPPTSSIEIPPATAEEAKSSLPATDPPPPEIPTSIDNANKEDTVEEPGYAMVQQPEARNSPSDWSDIHHETTNGTIDSLSEPQQKQEPEAATKAVEDALKAAQSELEASQRAFSDLQVAMQKANNTIDDLKKERDQIQSRAEVEKGELLDEVGRLKGIIGLERQEREERIEGLEREIDELRGRVSQQSATIDQLQENLAYSQEENRNLDIENEGLNTTLMEHQDYISRLEEKLAEEEEEVKGVEGKIQELETQVIRCEQGFERARNLVTEKENHLKMVEMNNNNLSSQLAHLRTNLAATERENRMAMDQLRRQSNELQKAKGTAVQPNLNISRSIINGPRQARIENAITAVKLLNEEVFQTAAAITDQLEYVPKRFVADDHGGSAKAEVLKATLGLELVTKLTKEASFSSETYNPFFLQMALQGCLIASCMRITTSWYPAEWEYANFLFVLYERIRGTGEKVDFSWKV